jgi:hypothetical protein
MISFAERQRGARPSDCEVSDDPILADARTSTSLTLGEEVKSIAGAQR